MYLLLGFWLFRVSSVRARRIQSIDKAALYLSTAGLPERASAPRVTMAREAFELLRLKDRAMDNTKEGITIADCSLPDMPLIYANEAFARITGYSVAEALGKNCRFLQARARRALTLLEPETMPTCSPFRRPSTCAMKRSVPHMAAVRAQGTAEGTGLARQAA